MRQLIGAMFYLFGFLFFLSLPSTLFTPDSRISVGILVLKNFFVRFAFAANVFLILLVLHCVQWLASAKSQACALQLNEKVS